jgi:ABC-2 type transport system permease protein
MMAFFGSITQISTPAGYTDTYYYSMMTVIVGILAVSVGAGLVASDEEKGILDLVMAHPISRTRLYWARLLAFALALALVLVISWLGWAVPSGSTGMRVSWLDLLVPNVPLLAELLLFGCLAVLLSMLLPASRMAGMAAGLLLVANYLLLGLSNLNEGLKGAVKLTPLYYYQGGLTMRDGLNWGWLAGLLGVSIVLALAGWILFQRRDIRVGGERSFSFRRRN